MFYKISTEPNIVAWSNHFREADTLKKKGSLLREIRNGRTVFARYLTLRLYNLIEKNSKAKKNKKKKYLKGINTSKNELLKTSSYIDYMNWFENQTRDPDASIQSHAIAGNLETQTLYAKRVCCDEQESIFWFWWLAEREQLHFIGLLADALEFGNGCDLDLKKAFIQHLRAAQHPKATSMDFYHVARCYYVGRGTPLNLNQAIFWLEKAVALSNDDALFPLALAHKKKGNVEKALIYLKQVPQNHEQYQDAQYELGSLLLSNGNTKGTEVICKNLDLLGNTLAAFNLIVIKMSNPSLAGRVLTQEELDIVEKTCRNADPATKQQAYEIKMSNQIHLHQQGLLNETAEEEFFKRLIILRKVHPNDQNFLNFLGIAYKDGIGTEVDFNKAKECFQKFLNMSNPGSFNWQIASFQLGCLLMNFDTPEDSAKALAYFKGLLSYESKTPHTATAHFYSGKIYFEKPASEESLSLAKEHFQAAAELKDQGAIATIANILTCEALLGEENDFEKLSKAYELYNSLENASPVARFTKALLLLFDTSRSDTDREEGIKLLADLYKNNSAELYLAFKYLKDIISKNSVLSYLEAALEEDLVADHVSWKDSFFLCNQIKLLKFIALFKIENDGRLAPGEDWRDCLQADFTPSEMNTNPTFLDTDEDEADEEDDILRMVNSNGIDKWRNVQKALKTAIKKYGGRVKQGSGSRLHVEMAGQTRVIHTPHGNDSTVMRGGALRDVRTLISSAASAAGTAA